jgi:hypothetical protein
MDDLEKCRLGNETLKFFCGQFGNDIYAQILLEVLFEGLINAEIVFVFGEPKQAGDQVDNGSSG